MSLLIAFDGHDGSGKTTIAQQFAEKTDAVYLRPFGGNNGIRLMEYADQKAYEKASLFALDIIHELMDKHKNELLIFDRHWMTVFTLIPSNYWEKWMPLPQTVLCYADLDTTLKRLKERKEKKYTLEYHRHYLSLYLSLAEKYNAYVLRTDQNDVTNCLNILLKKYSK